MAPLNLNAPIPPSTDSTDLFESGSEARRLGAGMLARSVLAAAALALTVCGGAYAAVRVADDAAPTPASAAGFPAGQALGGEAVASASAEPVTVEAATTTVTTVSEDVTEAHGSVRKESADLPEGETKVETPGVDGVVRTVYEVTVVDGQEVSRVAISTTVVSAKVDEVTVVGTGAPTPAPSSESTGGKESTGAKEESSTSPAPSTTVADGDVWARLAQCESGGNPATNTGNGYYGMYQFSLSTWQSVGGSGLPSDASAEEQTMRAQFLQARAGWGQWPHCAGKLGLL